MWAYIAVRLDSERLPVVGLREGLTLVRLA